MDGITTQEKAQSRIHRMRWWTLAIVSVTVLLSGRSRNHRAPVGRVEAGHAASRVWLSIGWPSAWYRARHRGPWKTAIVPSGYSWTRTLALTCGGGGGGGDLKSQRDGAFLGYPLAGSTRRLASTIDERVRRSSLRSERPLDGQLVHCRWACSAARRAPGSPGRWAAKAESVASSTPPSTGDPLVARASCRAGHRGRLRRCAPRLGAARLRPWACKLSRSQL